MRVSPSSVAQVAFFVLGGLTLAAVAGLACHGEGAVQSTRSPGVAQDDPFVWPEPGTTVYHSLRGDVWRPIIGELAWQQNVVDDPNRTPVEDPAIFQKVASEFQEFPLYWLGLEFQGLPLSGITRSHRPHVSPPEDHVILSYGTCQPRPEVGCSEPIQLRVEPCRYGPHSPAPTDDDLLHVRGVDAFRHLNPALWLWTGEVFVTISAYPEERMLEAAEALVSANGQGPTTADEPLPPVDRRVC